ncbi:hypothetical protein FJZ36_11535 [Candidatus Poribacteria bacterium]|nr:hypothetical protein [Candidatus Poribacteria bacterium]
MTRRFLLDNDGSNFFCHTMTDDVDASVAAAVGECPESITTYLLCAGAGTYYYPTEVGDVIALDSGGTGREGLLRELHARGVDPFGRFLQALKAAGKETFITYRMNDVHNADEPDHPLVPRFKRENPDCVVDPDAIREGKADWMCYCYDYSRRDVRDYILATIRELSNRYEFDGLQLDWMRFPRHLSGTPQEVWEKRDVLTDFLADVRQAINAGGARRLLGARVPTTPDGCRHVGIDLAAWARHGLVDWIVATPFLTTDFTMPIPQLRDLTGTHDVPIYADVEFEHGTQVHCPESLRAVALSLFDSGADGIYVFNFPCWTEYIAARPMHWLDDMATPERAAAKPLLFSASHRRYRLADVDQQGVLAFTLGPGGIGYFPIRLPSAALPARRALALVHSGADVSLEVNNVPATELPFLRRAELFPEFVPHRAMEERPRSTDCRVFEVEPDALRAGHNQFGIRNDAEENTTIQRVNLGLW